MGQNCSKLSSRICGKVEFVIDQVVGGKRHIGAKTEESCIGARTQGDDLFPFIIWGRLEEGIDEVVNGGSSDVGTPVDDGEFDRR